MTKNLNAAANTVGMIQWSSRRIQSSDARSTTELHNQALVWIALELQSPVRVEVIRRDCVLNDVNDVRVIEYALSRKLLATHQHAVDRIA